MLGISKDSVGSHQKFKAKHRIPFLLLSDSDGTVCREYGVLKEKDFLGKKILGIERSTFIIDEKGTVAGMYRGVKVDGHIREVLEAL